ncbi:MULTISPECIES: glutathione-disulfide reductase [unclassified Mesorhizobium]|uniref:glutathione-disulfide reductase n=1 Tax=unclassified Mesorhizobium TaxID=325217 RepID=UPI000FD86C71|nr:MULTISPECIES: glutathione-disulfide reductase [unclassified Mesorhizobium]TGQ09032.1 glutathione-disulfide reductase [Mesorhizobium sp. M2E.F.Ca.ET.219.01.1.1]TGT69567.1 glutathione-disulfide reductase [Mesorhizobium sp. M2E.F.Ca.ET.166.01.1.1]TGW01898.1 glutathione-disulfide reductase [Mesorhizobium sp. M2E.F.Ca.ET.154.01.1.1]
MAGYDYDLFVIGGGSGGVRAARVAAALGKRVAIAEEYRYGGTCVIRGCVPKKLYVYASQFPEHFADAAGYGWTVPEASFDWPTLVANKDKEIARLEAIYKRNVEGAGGETFHSRAVLVDQHSVYLVAEDRTVSADQILIATGGRPAPHPALSGHEYCIFSNEAFDLKELPKAIMIEGGGYIAVEFANIFHGLGVETTLVYRGQEILSRFDMDLRRSLHETMEKKGIKIVCPAVSEWVRKTPEGRLDVLLSSGQTLTVDQVMLAIGRIPNTENMGLEGVGVELSKTGAIVVDKYSRTNIDNIWAIGDVTHRVQLTPVAIHEAMCFIETAFKGNPTSPDHDTIPTAVFSQPEIGTVGLSEDDAIKRFPDVEIYRASFRPMRHTLSGRDEKMLMKLVVDGSTRKVIGAHILGPDAGEMAQLLGIPLKAGLTKDDFDRTMAVHPTAAEELVTMYKPSYRVKNGERV